MVRGARGRTPYVLILAGAGALMLAARERKFPPSLAGKISTAFQILAALLWMVRNAWPLPGWTTAAWIALALSAAATLVSGLEYGWTALRHLRRRG